MAEQIQPQRQMQNRLFIRRIGKLAEDIASHPIANFTPEGLTNEENGFCIGDLILPFGIYRRFFRGSSPQEDGVQTYLLF